MFILMAPSGMFLDFNVLEGMAAEGGALLFFLRVRVEVGEGENTGLQCSQYAKTHLGTRRGRHSSVCRQRRLLLPWREVKQGQSVLPPLPTRKMDPPVFQKKDSTYTAIMSDINYNVWTSNSQIIYNDELVNHMKAKERHSLKN